MSSKTSVMVQEIMTKNLYSVNLNQSVEDVKTIMERNCVRHVPVLDGGNIIGIISKIDLERFASVEIDKNHKLNAVVNNNFTIEQVMTKNLNCINPEDTIKEAAEIMSLCSYHALPVVVDEKLVGIITTTDLLDYLLDNI